MQPRFSIRKDIVPPAAGTGGRWPLAVSHLWRLSWLNNTSSSKVMPLSTDNPDPMINCNVSVKSWSSCPRLGKIQSYPISRTLHGVGPKVPWKSQLNLFFCSNLLPTFQYIIPKNSLINVPHTNLYLRLCFLGTQSISPLNDLITLATSQKQVSTWPMLVMLLYLPQHFSLSPFPLYSLHSEHLTSPSAALLSIILTFRNLETWLVT